MLTAREHRERAVAFAHQIMVAVDATDAAKMRRAAAAHLMQAEALERDAAFRTND